MVACASTLHPRELSSTKQRCGIVPETTCRQSGWLCLFFGYLLLQFFSNHPAACNSFFICEAFGFEAGLDKQWSEPGILHTYTGILVISAIIILIPGAP